MALTPENPTAINIETTASSSPSPSSLTHQGFTHISEVQTLLADYSRWHTLVRFPCALHLDSSLPAPNFYEEKEMVNALTTENQLLEALIAQARAQQLANQILAKKLKHDAPTIVTPPWDQTQSQTTSWSS